MASWHRLEELPEPPLRQIDLATFLRKLRWVGHHRQALVTIRVGLDQKAKGGLELVQLQRARLVLVKVGEKHFAVEARELLGRDDLRAIAWVFGMGLE